jgi:hypothetical protein
MLITEIKVRIEPAIDQNSLTFSLFLDTIIRIEVTRTMRIGKRGLALSIIIGQPFISFISLPSMCLNFLKIRMIIASAIATSTAAMPIMNRVNIIPEALSWEINLLKATKFKPAPLRMSSIEMSIPIRVLL